VDEQKLLGTKIKKCLDMKSSAELFRKNLDKSLAGENITPEVMRNVLQTKSNMKEEELEGGLSDNKTLKDIFKKHKKTGISYESLKKQLEMGLKVEKEHTKKEKRAEEIAMDHLWEDPKYYTKLKKIEGNEATGTGSSGSYSQPLFSGEEPKKVEAKEATGSGSVGAYESPAAWAKSTNKKDWRGKSKTQIPGGAFVSVKKKCTKFPYCNKGDINALHIYKNESVRDAIKSVSEKMNISETTIKSILQYELEKLNKLTK
jgi:hypothetical protein